MCYTAIIEQIKRRITPRNMFNVTNIAGVLCTSICVSVSGFVEQASSSTVPRLPESVFFSQVVDLSHTLNSEFPAWFVPGNEVTTNGNRTFVPAAIVNVHNEWMGDKKWVVENLNNFDNVPSVGATILLGQSSIMRGLGGPNRVAFV